MTVIAWIGLGHMGTPMVTRLIKAGYTVKAYDVSSTAVNALLSVGVIPATSVHEAVTDAQMIFTMVQTSDQVHALCLDEAGIFSAMAKEAIYVDASSIDITMTKILHETAEKRGLSMLDAPVSGGVAGATAGTLTIMVGGDQALYEKMLPVFRVLGKNIVHAGGPGHGQAAKICNNLILAISMIGVSEAFSLAKKLGLNPKTFFDIASVSSGQCWSMTSYCPEPHILPNVPSSHDYKPGFMAKMMLKDLSLAKHAADFVKAYTPLGNEAIALYQAYVDAGHSETDFSGIIQWIADSKLK